MTISGKKICIVLYGIVDGRSIKTARALSGAGVYVKIILYTYSRKSYAEESFHVEYRDPAEAVPSKIKLRPFRILENLTIKRIKTLIGIICWLRASVLLISGVVGEHGL